MIVIWAFNRIGSAELVCEGINMEPISGYDERKTNIPEPKPMGKCTSCGCDLYEGDYLYTIDGECLCEECLNDAYREVL